MQSLHQSFEELCQYLRQAQGFNRASDDPVYYLVFRPEEMLAVKRLMAQWIAKLKLEGFEVVTFSMADAVQQIFGDNELRSLWLESEADDPLDFDSINKTLSSVLTNGDTLKNKLEAQLQTLKGAENTVLFVTDVEVLHPYLRVGALEQKLQGRFTVPTVILYPGVRAGSSTLSFLGIYPDDGNYRSIHIGG